MKEGHVISLMARRIGHTAAMQRLLGKLDPLTPQQADTLGAELIRIGTILRMHHGEDRSLNPESIALLAAAAHHNNRTSCGFTVKNLQIEHDLGKPVHDAKGNIVGNIVGPAMIKVTIQ